MKDHCPDAFSLLYKLMDLQVEIVRRPILSLYDIASRIIVVPYINYNVIFERDLIALDKSG